ncbi:MAG TPA: hypothetical protein VID95_14690, partial [Candidatus Limnocylindrales bacterium]
LMKVSRETVCRSQRMGRETVRLGVCPHEAREAHDPLTQRVGSRLGAAGWFHVKPLDRAAGRRRVRAIRERCWRIQGGEGSTNAAMMVEWRVRAG